jgi:hypothetical protein
MKVEAIEVLVMSPEAADDSVAELWVGGTLLGQTQLRDGQLILEISVRSDGHPWQVGARNLHEALDRARDALAAY